MRKIFPFILIPILTFAVNIHVFYAIYDYDMEIQLEFVGHHSSLRLEGVVKIQIISHNQVLHEIKSVITKDSYSEDNLVIFTIPKPIPPNFIIKVSFSNGKYTLRKVVKVYNDDA